MICFAVFSYFCIYEDHLLIQTSVKKANLMNVFPLIDVERTLELRLDVVLEANTLLKLVIDIFLKLLFNFEFVFQNMIVILP